MNVYFSKKFTNLKKEDITLEFSKKITKNEKVFLKLLFFKVASDSSFLEKGEIRLAEIFSIPGFSIVDDFTLFFKNLAEKHVFFTVSLPDSKISGTFGLISSFVLNSDYCKIFFTEEFKSCFSAKKGFFFLLEIEKFIFMSDSFSFGFYNNIIKNSKEDNKINLPVSVVKMYLNADNKYERFFDFEKHVLKKAVNDINTFTDFNIEYEKIKESGKATNKIVSINFIINKARQPYQPYDNAIYEMLQLVREKVSSPEKTYRLFMLYVAKRGYEYVHENINYVKNYPSENFEKKLKKALMFNLASNNLKPYIKIEKVVKTPIVLFYTLTRKINEIKIHYPKIDKLLRAFKLKDINTISYFKDNDSFEFSDEAIKIYVKYYSDRKSVIEIHLPQDIIEKIKNIPNENQYFNK